MYRLLQEQALTNPVPGNAHGSYLTMRSKNGIIFGAINIVGNFATVFQDQAYWQRAIASRPATTVKAYLLGGLAWYVSILNCELSFVYFNTCQVCHSIHTLNYSRSCRCGSTK